MDSSSRFTLYVDARLSLEAMVEIVATLTGGTVHMRDVGTEWADLCVADDGGDLHSRQREPDQFVYWDLYVDVEPKATTSPATLVHEIGALMRELRERGYRVVAVGDYSDELPGGGELM
jgi:hypothetical protein